MTEEKNGVTHGSANNEMAPQEDGTKVPLTDEPGQVKFSSNNPPNGDAKINISSGETFSGLSKEELMKFADDPFWVRLRWFLFIFFWAGWMAMLVLAIVIIIQAPRCAPKETLHWVQKSAMLQYDINNPVVLDDTKNSQDHKDLINMAESLGVTTVYMENLISPANFENVNGVYNSDEALSVLEAAKKAGLNVVTDFVPSKVTKTNPWFQNKNMSDFFNPPGTPKLDFSSQSLLEKLVELFTGTWMEKGVLGFLLPEANETLVNATAFINKGIDDMNGAVVSGVADVNYNLNNFSPEAYKEFLESHIDDWSYLKFNPKLAELSSSTKGRSKLVTMTLFLVPGTPILHGIEKDYFMAEKDFIKSLSQFREKESVQIGNTIFVNTTSEDAIAFTRIKKGTPGCAVAANFHQFNSTEVNFREITGVPEKGDAHIQIIGGNYTSGELERKDLSKIVLQPLEGVVVLFVPDL